MKFVLGTVAVLACAGLASAQALTLNGPSAQTFANGSGTGFGGVVGPGSFTFEVVGSNLQITFATTGTVNDYVALFLDVRSGGFGDADMNDNGDPGRNVISNLSRDGIETFPISPDFGYAFFGNSNAQVVGFELNAGSTANHLNYVAGSYLAGTRTAIIPLAVLGNPSQVDWFAAYSSDSGFLSNESLPGSLSGGNPGFVGGVAYTAFNRYTIPTPGAAALLGLGGLAMVRRRR